jgi:uncharacterized membrane protein
MTQSSSPTDYEQLLEYLKSMEARILRIEEHLGLPLLRQQEDTDTRVETPAAATESGEALELRIGETWFAKVGIIVLATGIAFLLTFHYEHLPRALPGLFGYLLVCGIIALSRFWRRSFPLISRYLLGEGLALLYLSTLRLHFFSQPSALAEKNVLLILLLAVVAINLYVSTRRNSIYLAGLSLTMGYVTAIVADQPTMVFVITTVMCALVVYFKLRYRWNALLVVGIVCSYMTHFIWAINNPLLGNEVHFVTSPQSNLLFLLVYASVLAAGDLFRRKDVAEDFRVLITSILNGLGCYGLYLLLTLTCFRERFALFHLLASLLFLTLSTVFWVRGRSKYATFIYAMLGYAALSVAILDRFGIPDNFIWLSWQTILVISTAVWFRSRFIVVANFVIYLIVFIAYLMFAGTVSIVSLSFGVIALLSARILNWQKDRLELRTEMMRTAYLVCAFFIFPYALYHTVPGSYVSLSWVGVALFYYVISLILKNKKYRWMALLTLLLTVGYVFIVDIIKLEPAYRVASFLVLGIVLLVISLVYSRSRST